jgi:hypothetical protein
VRPDEITDFRDKEISTFIEVVNSPSFLPKPSGSTSQRNPKNKLAAKVAAPLVEKVA